MKEINNNIYEKCENCGKQKMYENGCSTSYVPDSALTYEEFLFRCKYCTDKYGIVPAPQQCVTKFCSTLFIADKT